MPPKSHSSQSSASEGSPSPEVEDLSLAAFLSKIDDIKQKWDENNGNSTYRTEFGTQWSSQEWSDNFKGAFEAVGWENQSEEWQSSAMRFITSSEWEDQNIYSVEFKQDLRTLAGRASKGTIPDRPTEACAQLVSNLKRELKQPEDKHVEGRLTNLANFAHNILEAHDEVAFLELYSALSAYSKISELALEGGISALSIRVSYLPKVPDLLEIAGEAVIKVNKAHKSNVNKRNAANPRKKASFAIAGDDVGHTRAKRKKAFSPVSRREGSTHAGGDEIYERIMKIASSYPDKIEGEAQEKLYELWQAHDYEFNGKLEWLLAGLEHLGRKSERLLPNPKVFPHTQAQLEALWAISGGRKDKTLISQNSVAGFKDNTEIVSDTLREKGRDRFVSVVSPSAVSQVSLLCFVSSFPEQAIHTSRSVSPYR